MNTLTKLACAAIIGTFTPAAYAQDVGITATRSDSTFTLNGALITVTRNQDTTAKLQGDFARTSRACPPDCLQPLVAAAGVATLGELEVLEFLEDRVSNNTGLLLDARAPADFATGHIPGAVNVPSTTLAAENQFRVDILRALGAVPQADGRLDYTNAMSLAFYSGGVWSNDAATAINDLLLAGYPASKLLFYRGGMQAWVHVGLTAITPQIPD